jgi:hypothetical protein
MLPLKYCQIGLSHEICHFVAIRFVHGFLEYFFPRYEPEVSHKTPPVEIGQGRKH